MSIHEANSIRRLSVNGPTQFELGIILVLPEANKEVPTEDIYEALQRYCSVDIDVSTFNPEHEYQISAEYSYQGGPFVITTLADRSFTLIALPEEW